MMDNKLYIDHIGRVVFQKISGLLLPIGYDLQKDGSFKLLNKNPFLKIFVEFVIRSRKRLDPYTNKVENFPLYPYQWSASIYPIISTIQKLGLDFLQSFSRQSGKSEAIKVWMAFLVVFTRRFRKIKHNRFTCILGSYKKESIKKLTDEIKPYIFLAVQVYNEMFPESPLITGEDDNKLSNNSEHLEINMIKNGESIPYAEIFFITLGASQDSLASHLTVIDESGLVDNETYAVSVEPFSASTNGTSVFIGVPNHNPVSLIANVYANEDAEKLFYNWEDCYKLMSWVDEESANDYKVKTIKNIKKNGGKHSASVAWNYYVDFNSTIGKFMTNEVLERENIMSLDKGNMQKTIETSPSEVQFRVGSADISAKSDFFSLSFGITTVTRDRKNRTFTSSTDVHDMVTLNQGREDRLNIDQKVAEIIMLLQKYKIELFIVDSTASQKHFVQKLRLEMKKRDIPTMLLMYDYSEISKRTLFNMLEESLYDHSLRLLKPKSWETRKLKEEMLYFQKINPKTQKIQYSAPNKSGFTDDHMNSIALLNRAYSFLIESILKRKIFDDGADKWVPREIYWEEENEKDTKIERPNYTFNLLTGFKKVENNSGRRR